MSFSGKPWDAFSRSNALGNSITILRRRPSIPICLVLTFIFFLSFYSYAYHPFESLPQRVLHPASKGEFSNSWNYTRDAKNLKLTDEQCTVAFPELFREIERALETRKDKHVTLKEIDEVPIVQGYVRAMIYDQELYMLADSNPVNSRHLATLHALHRAIFTSPDPLPNVEFTMNVNDIAPHTTTWGYSRRADDMSIWLMPDFGYWSWPEPKVGTHGEITKKAIELEQSLPWAKKKNKLVWRGALMDLKVRLDLLNQTAGKSWSDVRELNWSKDVTGETHDSIPMSAHCEWKYVAHTEGVSYSSRLQNLQLCRSVMLAHKMKWIQHHSHLMSSTGSNQNYIQLAEDWSDLPSTMDKLLKMDKEKEGRRELERIAENAIKTFREHYLTPAAEACYWRRLIRSWAEISPEPEFYKEEKGKQVWRGLPVESYVIERRMDWDLH